jgi:hypothetical protein
MDITLRNLATATHPLGRLKAIAELRRSIEAVLDQMEVASVEQARSSGSSWQEVGRAVGLTRTAAMRRYG